jgi:hypothetical protein
MATFLGAVNGTSFGKFGTSSNARRTFIIANYVSGSGYRGESLEDIIPYLKRNLNESITKEKIFASLRLLSKKGYYFEDNKDWKKTRIYENVKFWRGRR